MEATSLSTSVQARVTIELPDRVLVVDRNTGELIDVLGDKLETNSLVAKAVSVAIAALSTLEGAVGVKLVKFEADFFSGYFVAQIDGDVIKVSVRSW